ncbi:MAG: DUF1127 domain-containing protein [Rhizobiales bacterium]|nr:DUF1127 domain-containing protein [Hyphomicrobiales bacterium]
MSMSKSIQNPSTHGRPTALRGALEAAVTALAAILESPTRLARIVARRRQVSRLLEYDDRMLLDMGVTRGDVHDVLSGPWSQDTMSRLATIRKDRMEAELAARRSRYQGNF